MRKKKYLLILLVALAMALGGCPCDKKPLAPPPELGAPSDLTALAASYKQINLSWQDNSDMEEGFRVCCKTGEGQYQTVDTLLANTTSFEHGNLQPLTKYTYYIQAYWKGRYANSEEVPVMTPDPIEILSPYIYGYGNTGLMLVAMVRNYAFERCKVRLRAIFYDTDGIEYDSRIQTSILAAGELRRVEFLTYKLDFPYFSVMPTFTLEILEAEILY